MSAPKAWILALGLGCVALGTPAWAEGPRADVLIADFEGKDYADWKATGEAFGPGPARGTLPNQMEVTGFEGKGLVNTYYEGDDTTGTLTSPPFIRSINACTSANLAICAPAKAGSGGGGVRNSALWSLARCPVRALSGSTAAVACTPLV